MRRRDQGARGVTIIVYRDGVMAADSVTSYGNIQYRGTTKIVRRADGTLAGAAGQSPLNQAFLAWVMAGENGQAPEMKKGDLTSQGVIARPDGTIVIHDEIGITTHARKYQAIGVGEDVAVGALFVGASAEDAVRAAIEHNAWCGGEVFSLRH